MTRSRSLKFVAAAAVVPLTVLAVAGCGVGTGSGRATAGPPKTTDGQRATVGVATTGLGKVLVDSDGTLYLFKKDPGAKSVCAGACASDWPPLRANAAATVGSGANTALVATTRRSDGASQVTYKGHPVYRYEGDVKPGQTVGQGITAFGAAWYALTPAGHQVAGSGSNSSAGSGY
jgi:predicted lipoprotein with Yx(FWY)xxD motif